MQNKLLGKKKNKLLLREAVVRNKTEGGCVYLYPAAPGRGCRS